MKFGNQYEPGGIYRNNNSKEIRKRKKIRVEDEENRGIPLIIIEFISGSKREGDYQSSFSSS